MHTSHPLWKQIPSIRCINLRSRPDRRQDATTVFQKLGIPVEFFLAEKHQRCPDCGDASPGIHGCFDSHLQIIEESYYRGDSMCLIFEDDVVPSSHFSNKTLRSIEDFLNSGIPWDLLYLGTHPDIVAGTTTATKIPGIYRMNSICTHAYLISRRFMSKMIHTKFSGVPIDYIYLRNPQAYGVYPSLFIQGNSSSDIGGSSWNESVFKPWWYRGVEMYAIKINKPLRFYAPILVGYLLIIYILARLIPSLFSGIWYWVWLLGLVVILWI